jgi:hypothetical protein
MLLDLDFTIILGAGAKGRILGHDGLSWEADVIAHKMLGG